MTGIRPDELNSRIGFDCVRLDRPIAVEAGIYGLTDEPNIDMESDSPEYVGYDAMGERYDRPWEPLGQRDIVARTLLRSWPAPPPRVLDVGAGTGRWSIPLSAAGAAVVAADISRNMLAVLLRKAKEAGVDVVACRANALSLPFRDACFDIAVIDALLHLVRSPERVVAEVKRVLRPGGTLVTFRSQPVGELPEETQEQNRRFEAVWNATYKRHAEISRERGQKHTPRPGWWGRKRIDNLRQYFREVDEIPVVEAVSEWNGSLRQQFRDLHNLAFSDMVRFDPTLNVEVMAQLTDEVEREHGPEVWDLPTSGRDIPVIVRFHD